MTSTPSLPAPVPLVAPRVVLGWPLSLRYPRGQAPDHLPEWPAGWPVPRVGEAVTFRSVAGALVVSAVDWMPEGDDEEDAEPMVYVALRAHT